MSDEKSWERLQRASEEARPAGPAKVFGIKFKDLIDASARRHVSHDNVFTCEIVQNEVLELLGFDLKPLLSLCGGFRSGIQPKIWALDSLARTDPLKCKQLNPDEAQNMSNISTGEYVVLAMMYAKLKAGGEKHHVAFVIPGEYSTVSGPCAGGGGFTQAQIDKGWVLSTALVHFTDWQDTKYFLYGFKKEAV